MENSPGLFNVKQIDAEAQLEVGIVSNESLKSIFDGNKKLGIHEIAKHLVKKFQFKTIEGSGKDEFYYYQDGIYSQKAKAIIKTEVEDILEEFCSTHYLKEIVEKVKRKTLIDREDFDVRDKNLICLNNGVLDIKKRKLIPHNPKYYFVSKIPVSFDKEADCPKIKKFLKEVVGRDVKTLQEWFGFVLYREYFLKKAMILTGEQNTGKTTLLNLLTNFIGRDNISGVALQKLAYNQFASASLYKKMVNLYDDLSFKDINDVGLFKISTGNGTMPAEFKFGDHFHFVNYAKLMFASNRIPAIKELDDDAYYSRWLIIQCDNQFEKRDTMIGEKLSTDEELSGLLNYALQGLKRITKNGQFSYKLETTDIKSIMERSSSSLASFVQDELVEEEESCLTKQELYQAYSEYISEKKLKKISLEMVGRSLTNYAPYIISGYGKGKKRVWRNVALKNPTNPEPVRVGGEQLVI